MRHLLANLISTPFSLVKFCFIKLFHPKGFRFHLLERFSPQTIIRIGRGSAIVLGNKVRAHTGSKFMSVAGGRLTVGDNCRFNYNCMIVCRHRVTLAPGVECGPNVLIYDHDHDFRAEGGLKVGKFKCGAVTVGENTWIGANTTILRGTTIGANCVIGAGSVVKGNIPDNTMLVQTRENKTISLEE